MCVCVFVCVCVSVCVCGGGLVVVVASAAGNEQRGSETTPHSHSETLFMCPPAAELPLSLIFLPPFSSSSSSPAVKLLYSPSLSVIRRSFPPPVLFVPVVQDDSFLLMTLQ